jgi:endonuclease YncB( thermonuclease family)
VSAGRVAACLAVLAGLLVGGGPAWASLTEAPWTGRVSWVSDGDTLWLQAVSGGKPVKVRILGIDAPEGCQAGGAEATARLLALVKRRQLQAFPSGSDDYGRVLARLELDHVDIGRQLVLEGLAWSYRFKQDPGPYATEEAQARAARRGLHQQPQALRPRDFRRQHGPCVAPIQPSTP